MYVCVSWELGIGFKVNTSSTSRSAWSGAEIVGEGSP